MIKFQDIKIGDLLNARFDGQVTEGEVIDLNHEDHQVCMLTFGQQEFWYAPQDLSPIPLTEAQLLKLKFIKSDDPELNVTGQAYVRGPFIVLYPEKGNNEFVVLKYRDEVRELHHALMVHELQNHYREMTKIDLHP